MPTMVFGQGAQDQYVDNSVIVKYKESPILLEIKAKERLNREDNFLGKLQNLGQDITLGISGGAAPETTLQKIDNLSQQIGAEKANATDEIGNNVFALNTDGKQEVKDIVNFLNQQKEVDYAEPNYLYDFLAVPNDTYYNKMWALTKIKAPQAWDQTTGSKSIIAAIIDSGIDVNHEDLKGNIVATKDFTGCGMQDDVGHGTHTAGTVGAVGNNTTGVVGINWTVGIMALKVGCSGKDIALSTVTSAINYAADNGARVINMSLGGSGSSQSMADAISNAVKKNVVVVVAAGNSSGNNADSLYPASDPNVITVSATGPSDELAHYSSYGTCVDVAAPGGNPSGGSSTCTDATCIASTWPGNKYNILTGTSMASPHVAGLAALVLSKNPSLTSLQVRQIIESSAVDLGTSGKDIKFGAGRIDVKAALDKVTGGSPLPTPTNSLQPTLTTPVSTTYPTALPTGITPQPTSATSKDRGDYDSDGTITYNDFVKWKDDFVQTLSKLRYFESWRKIYFSINRAL
ncbi:hypothetical protein A3C23_02125 [Candidatus Roizmanbacteria bacterium RIFCSPHIGHO2_02_FULL_37_13b]|uniref:Uncharacterized protein n=1 Tax=Candidatus Roizmanbacteria bacterium RIFCSPLOWO2_02_FULL_36_11 TaxID=1802071 RepID=A0A1F7JGP3_9BACT|nr:MAG: hypothetical protein A3C23_02125 [Candidatus Roizmanbacteria bacterium RIFCSPHIGHO2_02_FULL_37_13b]OGK54772.1 MAG: hypothetical protein A3H78_05805 [Candidatus Roizmanbacteria bacterium RIFCSPLOWO2_02_FULL_36_11]